MVSKTLPPAQRSGSKGGFFPALCTFIGILLIAAVILACLPLVIPRFLGYELYEVVSGSMEPSIPVGSVVYVGEAKPEDIESGDVIVFYRGEDTVTHRVVENRRLEGLFITKGDANPREDPDGVPYDALIGRVERHFPAAGRLMKLFASSVGKIYLLGIVMCGVLLLALASLLRSKRNARSGHDELLEELRQELVRRNGPDEKASGDSSSGRNGGKS